MVEESASEPASQPTSEPAPASSAGAPQHTSQRQHAQSTSHRKSRLQKLTRITKMEMKGFKSFANKIEMNFGENFNCILGPNGSGKSNVLDALCFVLGKSSVKGLRAEKASHLIYNGGKLKNPAHEAEVSLYLDNTEGVFPYPEKEIKVTRIIRDKKEKKKKEQAKEPNANEGSAALTNEAGKTADSQSAEMTSGPPEAQPAEQAVQQDPATQGIYKINGKTKTRQQILELLSLANINPDGYNIILQGDITYLIEMPSIERRKIIEEISGINLYEEKKERAIKELQKVEQKLAEADIIIAERKTYLNELKKERDQASKFKELDMKIKQNKATLVFSKVEKKKDSVKEIGDKIQKIQDQIDHIREGIKKLRAEADEKRKEIEKINAEVEQRGEKDQVMIQKEIETLKVEQAVRESRLQTIISEQQKLENRRRELEQSKSDLQTRINNARDDQKRLRDKILEKHAEIRKIEAQLRTFREKHSMDSGQGLDEELSKTDQEADELQHELTKMREEQQDLFRKKDKLELMMQSIDEKIRKVTDAEDENKAQVKKLKEKQDLFKKITLDLNKSLSEDSSMAAELQAAKNKLSMAREELSKLEARNITVRETVAGGIAIQKILGLNKEGVYGLVSSLGNVSSQFSLALEVAAGGRIKSIVVDNDRTAEACIQYLKENKLGIATFLPINKMKESSERSDKKELLAIEGVKGFASELVQYDPKFSKVFSYVFENTLVVDSIAVARKIGIGKIRMVTLAGDLLESSGAMHGGFRQKTQGLGFVEKEVTDAINSCHRDIAESEHIVSKLEQKRLDQDELITRLRQKKAELEGDMITLEKTLHLDSSDFEIGKSQKKEAEKELKEIDDRIEILQGTMSEKSGKLTNLKMLKQQLRDKVTNLRSPAILAELNVFEDKKKEQEKNILEMESEDKNLEGQISSIFIREQENLDRILKQQHREKEQFEKELKDIESVKKGKESELAEKEKLQESFYAQFKNLFAQRNQVSDAVAKIEQDALNREEKSRNLEQQMNLQSLESAKLKAELAGLEEEFKQYELVELFKDKSEDSIQKEIWQFEKMQSDIGAVNMKALELYEQVEREFQLIVDKKKTLGQERGDILILMNEIDMRKTELFMRTFKVVDKNFQAIFQALSTKGEAFLELENEQDPFIGGLTIKVRLSGTKFLDIRSLSGGEKTLTALAFLFAVQEHEPASFYVLDEVDAALDKRNSEKLAQLVKNYAAHAQYIMISHNDSVISESDNLYGVSMNEHGISKVTSLKI